MSRRRVDVDALPPDETPKERRRRLNLEAKSRLKRRHKEGFDKQLLAASCQDIIDDIAQRFGIDPYDEIDLGRLLEYFVQDRRRSVSEEALAILATVRPSLLRAANDERELEDELNAMLEDLAEKIMQNRSRRTEKANAA